MMGNHYDFDGPLIVAESSVDMREALNKGGVIEFLIENGLITEDDVDGIFGAPVAKTKRVKNEEENKETAT